MTALVGCAKKAEEVAQEQALEALTGGAVDIERDGDSQTMTFEDKDGSMKMSVGDKVSMPADYPSDVFTLPGAKLNQAVTGGGQSSIAYTASGTKSEVFATIRNEMKQRGWTEGMAAESADAESLLTFEKQGRTAMYSIDAAPDGGVLVTQNAFAPEPEPAATP
jgi:hypothetical protein